MTIIDKKSTLLTACSSGNCVCLLIKDCEQNPVSGLGGRLKHNKAVSTTKSVFEQY